MRAHGRKDNPARKIPRMAEEARHHHHIPQFYLRGFSMRVGNKKKWKIIAGNVHENRYFETTPRNIAGVRDFNRVEIDGIDPDYVENGLAQFEGMCTTAVQKVALTLEFDGDDRISVLNLISLLAVRSPPMRENMCDFRERVAHMQLGMVLHDKGRYERQFEKMAKWMESQGETPPEFVDYEKMKEGHEKHAYKVEVATEAHLRAEFKMQDTVLRTLVDRKWMLRYINDGGMGCFVTSDLPVVLTWDDPENMPVTMRQSPGHGMTHTEVLFPLTKQLCLVGSFEGPEGVQAATAQFVAHANLRVIEFCTDQFYTPKRVFTYLGPRGDICQDGHFMDRWKRVQGDAAQTGVATPTGKLPG